MTRGQKYRTCRAGWAAVLVALAGGAGCRSSAGRGPSGAEYHIVERGETAYGIARKYGVPLASLVRANQLDTPELLHPGTGLWIPGPDWNGEDFGPPPIPPEKDPQAAYLPPSNPGPTPEPMPRVSLEQAKACDDVSAVEAPDVVSGTGFSWPLDGIVIRRFGRAKGPTPRGVEIAAPRGAAVRAAADGEVMFSGADPRLGSVVVIRHADNRKTFYGRIQVHCVQSGERVERGRIVGLVGDDGRPGTPMLYFEVRQGERSVPPRRYLPSEP